MKPIMLIRYDTEGPADDTAGFLDKALEVHRRHEIPVTLFCTGRALENRDKDFRQFAAASLGDPLIDIQDHSYSHIGACYEKGKSVDELREDYHRSFEAHRSVIGRAPFGVSICGTGGRDGSPLSGFDATDKSRQEFEMLVELGVRMINTRLSGLDESRQFCSYARLGHPEVMGFVSAHSDTGWFFNKPFDQAMDFILGEIERRGGAGEHMPVLMHDWCAWKCAPDHSLDHVVRIAEAGRRAGFELRTHAGCYDDAALWQQTT